MLVCYKRERSKKFMKKCWFATLLLGEGERGKKKEKGEREKEKGVGAEDLMQTCP